MTKSKKIQNIIQLIEEDVGINHCRINLVNGCKDIQLKYKNNLLQIQHPVISVKSYTSPQSLYEDLFVVDKTLKTDWFNLIIFNLTYCLHICQNPQSNSYKQPTNVCDQNCFCQDVKCMNENITVQEYLLREIKHVHLLTNALQENFDSKYYTTMIVSMLDLQVLQHLFSQATGSENHMATLRYLHLDFDEKEILSYLQKILYTHSTKFLNRWERALDQFEEYATLSRFIS